MFSGKIAVIGLGYVGLPLAVEFGKKYDVLGFDIDYSRIEELSLNFDRTLEVESSELEESNVSYTSNIDDIKQAEVYIVTVPTPVNEKNMPDLSPLLKASETVGKVLSPGNTVIFESTVYPGATEEDCVPVLEAYSKLTLNEEFYVGYSPERINPGDKNRKLKDIVKVTSGSTEESAEFIDWIYSSIIVAGTYKAPSIKVAEGAKIIENVQRDVNIALINELYQVFDQMGVNINDVVDAASTKWNFMKLKPGLVGGHCISVDPYYLLHKSQEHGYIPDILRKAREVNDGVSSFLCNQFVRMLIKKSISPINLNLLLLGFSFKENCPDLRNTKVIDIYNNLKSIGFNVDIYDPLVDEDTAWSEYGVKVLNNIDGQYDVGFLAVPHNDIVQSLKDEQIDFQYNYVFDFKNQLTEMA